MEKRKRGRPPKIKTESLQAEIEAQKDKKEIRQFEDRLFFCNFRKKNMSKRFMYRSDKGLIFNKNTCQECWNEWKVKFSEAGTCLTRADCQMLHEQK